MASESIAHEAEGLIYSFIRNMYAYGCRIFNYCFKQTIKKIPTSKCDGLSFRYKWINEFMQPRDLFV